MTESIQERIAKEIEVAKTRALVLGRRVRREVKPSHDFFQYIDEAQKELNEGLNFLRKAEENPELMFLEAHLYLRKRGMVHAIMNHWRNDKESIKGHDFQVYLADVADRHFQKWIEEKGIEDSFRIEVRKPNQFPSIFAVYQEDREIIQFDIFGRWYGVRENFVPEEVMLEEYEQEIERMDKEIFEQEEILQNAINKRERPYKYFKGFKNFITLMIVKEKKIYQALDKMVRRAEKILEGMKEDKERVVQYFPGRLEDNQKREKSINAIEPFFKNLAYDLNENKSSLY